MKPALGLWIDDSATLALSDDYLDKFRSLGFTRAAIMLETIGANFDPKWAPSQLALAKAKFAQRGIELVLTIWPEPRVEYLASLIERLPKLLEVSGAKALEFDAEGNYTKKKMVGFRSMDEASAALARVVEKFRTDFGVRVELTTLPMHGENSKNATLAPQCDVIIPQAYSVKTRKDVNGRVIEIPWEGHPHSPREMQRLTLKRANTVPKKNGRPTVACGLAAYDQSWPGHNGIEAMRVAYEEALTFEPSEVRWWSSKWVLGARRNHYAERFFQELMSVERAGV
jgi:hypothetical protein